jgi:hypothetical protein
MSVLLIEWALRRCSLRADATSAWRLSSVVAGAGAGLMSWPPHRPAQPVAGRGRGRVDQGGEQVLDLVAGQQDQPGRRRPPDALKRGGHDQEGVGEHG